MTRSELLAIIHFFERLRATGTATLGLDLPDPVWSMVVFLLRRHLDERLVTVTSLAAASGAPYTTAMRHVDRLLQAGLIFKRPRTSTGRSFSLHPSPILIERFHAAAEEIKTIVADTFGHKGNAGYYFGTSLMVASIIPEPSPLAHDGPPLRLLANDEPVYLVLRRLLEAGRPLTGAPIRLELVRLDRLHARTLANAARSRSAFDILAVDLPWVGEYGEQQLLRPLDELIRSSNLNRFDFHPAGWDAGRFGGRQLAVPIQPMPELLFIRTDLLALHSLAPPTTTGEVLDTAARLADPARERYGIAWNARHGTPVGQTFVQLLAAFGSPLFALRPVGDDYDLEQVTGEALRPQLLSAAARDTCGYMRELLAHSPPEILEMAWNESVQAFARGRVAMAYGWSCRAGRFELDSTSPAAGRVAYLPHPAGYAGGRSVSPIGGSALAIPSNLEPSRVPAAWAAIEWLTSPEVMKRCVLGGSLVSARFSVGADPEVRAGRAVITIVDRLARDGQLRLWPRPPVPEFQKTIAILGEEIHAMLRRSASIDDSLIRAQGRVDSWMRERGHY